MRPRTTVAAIALCLCTTVGLSGCTTYYDDSDSDSYGDSSDSLAACTQPTGYVTDSTDCDDTSGTAASTFPGAAPNDSGSACMKDADGDDYGDDNPPGGVTAGTDCDDTDNGIWASCP